MKPISIRPQSKTWQNNHFFTVKLIHKPSCSSIFHGKTHVKCTCKQWVFNGVSPGIFPWLNPGESQHFCEVLVVDFSSSISSLRFTDLDLDPLELGGVIAWNEPGTPSSRAGTWRIFHGEKNKKWIEMVVLPRYMLCLP